MKRNLTATSAIFIFLHALSPGSQVAQAQTIRLGKSTANPPVKREEFFIEETNSKMVRVSFQMGKLKLSRQSEGAAVYSKLAVAGLPLTSEVGMPALPFQAVTIDAERGEILVRAELGEPISVKAGRILPAQVEPCRCAEPLGRRSGFSDHLAEYQAAGSGFRIESLGDFRGQAVSRVLLLPHKYDSKTGVILLYPNARFEISYRPRLTANAEQESLYDYLVITPREFMGGLASWVDWKRSSQGLRFNVVAYEDLALTTSDALKSWVHAEYARSKFKYALIVGGKNRIPQQTVETTTDKITPSDLPYFTMGGAADVIPDVYAGRVVVENAESLTRVLKKWQDYERDTGGGAGWHRALGVASEEGTGPSDAEYITAIQNKFVAAMGSESVYLYQNNADSNPANFNKQMASGAMWMTYIGHGSGLSWPSFGQTYGISDILAMRNAGSVKPIWIDVACLNGSLESGAAGSQLTNEVDPGGNSIGVTAYYGGTVLVSWHPPAIFARGVAFKVTEMMQPTLGEAIQAGQRYLTENFSDLQEIASNQRWYHLQGDPSLRVRLK